VTAPEYRYRAVPWDEGWELHITGPGGYEGTTQCGPMAGHMEAARMVRSYVALDLEVGPDSFLVSAVDIRMRENVE
jgi:hypothetical protein